MAAVISKSELKRRVEGQVCLPASPGVLGKVLDACRNRPSETGRLAELAGCDPSIVGQLLRLVGSPVTRRRQMPPLMDLIDSAGVNAVRDIALSTAVSSNLPTDSPFAAHEGRFWRHALACGCCAQSLAGRVEGISESEAHAAGLLHDIGKLALQATVPDAYTEVWTAARVERIALHDAEQNAFGVNHAQVGKWLAEAWNLPERVAQAIWLHHHATGSLDDTRFPSDLLDLINLAQAVVYKMNEERSSSPELESHTGHLLERVGLSANVLPDVQAEVVEALARYAALLRFQSEEQQAYQVSLRESVREALHQRADLASEERQLATRAARMHTLHEMNLQLGDANSLVDVIQAFVQTIREGLELSQCLCVVTDSAEQFLYGQSWRTVTEPATDLYVHLSTGECTGVEQLPEDELATLRKYALTQNDAGWVGGTVRALSLRDGLVFAPMIVDGVTVGLIIFEEDALGAGTIHDISDDVEDYAAAFGRALLQSRTEEDREDQSEDLATALGRQPASGPRYAQRPEVLEYLGQLAKGAAHYINNPLMVISGTAQVAMAKSDDPEVKKDMQTIYEQCRRAGHVLTDMQAFGEPPEPACEPVMLNFLIHRVIESVRERLEGIGIQVNELLGEGIPRAQVDPKLIELVLQKIIQNAIDAMSASGGLLTLETVESPDRSGVMVRVGDTGEGISPEAQAHLYEPFFSTKERVDRPGLGLAVAYGIVTKHGGEISIESTPGGGTIVELSLPVSVERAGEAKAETIEVDQDAHGSNWGRILVVDDDKDLRMIVEESFKRHGYFVRTAPDGQEALGILATTKIDAVVLDLQMPNKTGLEVLSEIHQKFSELPVIIMTGYSTRQETDEVLRLGARACLTKPFEMQRLLDEVRSAVAARTYPV
jgi:putative nucleotidyltransferase with HDIG domain